MNYDSIRQNNRLISLDFFRGLTIAGMILVNNPGSWKYIYAPFKHAEWHGWTYTDTIFPFFLFIVGVSITFALSKRLEITQSRLLVYKKIISRTLIIFGIGLFLNTFPFFHLSSIRIMGVLQRIALCYLFASIIFINTSKRGQFAWAIALLMVYWVFMALFAVPEVGAGSYVKNENFAAYIDRFILSGHMWSQSKTWDPEGLFSTLPAISTTLFGVLTGYLLKSKLSAKKKIRNMIGWGIVGIVIGYIWSLWLPINKSLWTSSYSVLMAGLALIVLAFCYFIIDVKGYKKVALPCVIFGMNAIAMFVLSIFIAKFLSIIKIITDDGTVSLQSFIYTNFFQSIFGNYLGSFLFAIIFILLLYIVALVLYKNKIFIKV
jgi:predicted acyltransferase